MKRAAVALALLCSGLAYAQASLSASEAKNHVGDNATVCGEVASAHYAAQSRGNPTFINLDKPYPNQVFTVVIWGSDRAKFGDPETSYSGKHICVTGRITMYRGGPETVVHEPSQVKVQ
jgi:DNA/RNA endonuclease YhcR with UshA esterase domain